MNEHQMRGTGDVAGEGTERTGSAGAAGSGDWPADSSAGTAGSSGAGTAGSGDWPADSSAGTAGSGGAGTAGSGDWPADSSAGTAGSGGAGTAGSGDWPADSSGGATAADTRTTGSDAAGSGTEPLLPERDLEAANRRWHDIQSTFVDDPRRAIADADALVGQLVQQVTALFDAERAQFEALWDRGGQVSTEELRVGLQRYRSFFQRLLST